MSEPTKILYDGYNMPYRLWAGTVKNLLYAKDCYEAIASKLYEEKDGDKVFSAANGVKNGKAASIILQSLSSTLAVRYADGTAYEMWKGIKDTFNVRTTNVLITELRELLTSSMASGDNPVEYWMESG
ncbi:hypothetical protein H4218_006375, partial [Coemansia sp. IMI 209128]